MFTTRTTLFLAILGIAVAGRVGAADMQVKAPPPAPTAPLFVVNDNSIGYYYAPTATNPGAGETPKHVLSFTHFDVWDYGTNFLNVEWLKATNGKAPNLGTPAAPCDQNGPLDPPGSARCPGYTEIYGFLRSTFGWNQIFSTKAFSSGWLTNIEFAVGAFGAHASSTNYTDSDRGYTLLSAPILPVSSLALLLIGVSPVTAGSVRAQIGACGTEH
jgi:hypothetical protein